MFTIMISLASGTPRQESFVKYQAQARTSSKIRILRDQARANAARTAKLWAEAQQAKARQAKKAQAVSELRARAEFQNRAQAGAWDETCPADTIWMQFAGQCCRDTTIYRWTDRAMGQEIQLCCETNSTDYGLCQLLQWDCENVIAHINGMKLCPGSSAPQYIKSSNTVCPDGYTNLVDEVECFESAAGKLGLSDRTKRVSNGKGDRPKGCYFYDYGLWYAPTGVTTETYNRDKHVICKVR